MMLEIKGLRKSYGELEVLKGVDLSVEKGDVIAVLGPSGSGKDHHASMHQFPRGGRWREHDL